MEKGPYLESIPVDNTSLDDRIDFVFDRFIWQRQESSFIYIAVYNSHPENGPVDFTIQMREFSQEETFSEEVRMVHSIFEQANLNTDSHSVSMEERSRRCLDCVRDFTYGEVLFATFLPVLDYAKPKPGEVLYDLGCGSGLPMIIASMMYPDLQSCKGIELLEDLATLGLQVSERMQKICSNIARRFSPIELIQGDILTVNWSDADVIFSSAVCYSV